MLIPPVNIENKIQVRIMFEVDDVIFLNSDFAYAVKATSKIDKVVTEKTAQVIQEIIENAARATGDLELRRTFVYEFKKQLGITAVKKLEDMGLNIDDLAEKIYREGYENLILKTLEALISIVSSKTSISFAVAAIDAILEKLKDQHDDVIQNITIDKSKYNDGIKAIFINPDINNLSGRRIGDAIKEILKKVQENLEADYDKAVFISDFKEKIGKNHTLELENLGINLFFIDLRYVR